MGMPSMVHITRGISTVTKFGAVLVCVGYRLANEAPYPAALEDCYAALKYLKEHAHELGCNPDQIFVCGESAGGGLTAALCLYARDKGEVNIAFQMPLYPMLDYRDTASSKDNHALVWNTRLNHYGWKKYLKERWITKDVPVYASAALEEDYSDLPPAYTFVGDIEPFYCETLTFASKLRKAGISCGLDVYEGWFHGYDIIFPFRKKSRLAIQRFEEHFAYAQKNYFAKQKK